MKFALLIHRYVMDMGHTIPLSYLPQVGFPHFLMFLEVMLVCSCPGDFVLVSRFTLFDFYFVVTLVLEKGFEYF